MRSGSSATEAHGAGGESTVIIIIITYALQHLHQPWRPPRWAVKSFNASAPTLSRFWYSVLTFIKVHYKCKMLRSASVHRLLDKHLKTLLRPPVLLQYFHWYTPSVPPSVQCPLGARMRNSVRPPRSGDINPSRLLHLCFTCPCFKSSARSATFCPWSWSVRSVQMISGGWPGAADQ